MPRTGGSENTGRCWVLFGVGTKPSAGQEEMWQNDLCCSKRSNFWRCAVCRTETKHLVNCVLGTVSPGQSFTSTKCQDSHDPPQLWGLMRILASSWEGLSDL